MGLHQTVQDLVAFDLVRQSEVSAALRVTSGRGDLPPQALERGNPEAEHDFGMHELRDGTLVGRVRQHVGRDDELLTADRPQRAKRAELRKRLHALKLEN